MWNVSRLMGFRGFVVRIDQRFVRVVAMFVGAFLKLPPVGILVDPLYHLQLGDQAGSVTIGRRRRGPYIIEAYSDAARSKGDGSNEEEPASHLEWSLTAMQVVQKQKGSVGFPYKTSRTRGNKQADQTTNNGRAVCSAVQVTVSSSSQHAWHALTVQVMSVMVWMT